MLLYHLLPYFSAINIYFSLIHTRSHFIFLIHSHNFDAFVSCLRFNDDERGTAATFTRRYNLELHFARETKKKSPYNKLCCATFIPY